MLGTGLVISDNEVEQTFRRNFEKIEVEYVYFDPQVFVEKTTAEDAELRKYLQDNPQNFQTLNKFRMEYFTISADYYQDNVKVREREVRRYYKKYTDNYVTPPEVKARHILLKLVPDAPENEQQEKREQLNKLLAEIKAGSSFEELAKKTFRRWNIC